MTKRPTSPWGDPRTPQTSGVSNNLGSGFVTLTQWGVCEDPRQDWKKRVLLV